MGVTSQVLCAPCCCNGVLCKRSTTPPAWYMLCSNSKPADVENICAHKGQVNTIDPWAPMSTVVPDWKCWERGRRYVEVIMQTASCRYLCQVITDGSEKHYYSESYESARKVSQPIPRSSFHYVAIYPRRNKGPHLPTSGSTQIVPLTLATV